MLNREALSKKLFPLISKLFPDLHDESDLAKRCWHKIVSDSSFAHRAQCAQSSFLVPSWEGSLVDTVFVERSLPSYSVIAVDGSQIYPDRHAFGSGCFLVNTGGVTLDYGSSSKVCFFSEPHVLVSSDMEFFDGQSTDLVDFKREEYELSMMVQKALERQQSGPVCFMDGSLVFWPLEGAHERVKNFFLERYLSYLDQLHKNKVLVAGYISMPKSRELVNLVKLGLCRYTIADCIVCHKEHEVFPCKQVEHMVDTSIARFFLKKFERTSVFYSTSKIVESYPDHLRPAFVYCDVGQEIVRLEIPKWIATQKPLVDYICSVAIDQCKKGYGYPVCLAEAHEQAVVKANDREFFYHLLRKIGIEHNVKRVFYSSQKSQKKRGIGV